MFGYLSILLQEFLRFIDFRRQVWTSSSIWVVYQHKLPVVFPYLVLGQSPFTMHHLVKDGLLNLYKNIHLSCNIKAASLRFILGSKPPL